MSTATSKPLRTPARKATTSRAPGRKSPAAKAPTQKSAARKATPAKKEVDAAPAEAKLAGKKPRLVRDSFTMPQQDFDLIAALKKRALLAGHAAKKSELLRAGLHALARLDETALLTALDGLTKLKAGRPRKER
ncbi:hypothetical protein [Piscinibacter sp. HJYY11]|uniref:hypothetical protein n=1 Tax=Piscinibacter sp. HJYY11 TaxID=2801333 RepID=UPI00191CD908|nr:hypothetical protein [Piscinibacter sp. HJYY11]MBL0726204.1 hypothetical protein [Piscinibacter sp. HJYY11]